MNHSPEKPKQPGFRGRGTNINPTGRYEKITRVTEGADWDVLLADEERATCGIQLKTQTHKDTSRSIISTNDSPDVGMDASLNPYRGCEHGCIYCFARPTHEYLGYSAGVDFETQIFVKEDAAALLAEKLSSKSWEPKVITLSGVTDPYQPLERRLGITRACFEVLRDFRNPAAIITKSALVTRDTDIFKDMAAWNGIGVNMSITTLDNDLARAMEPRAAQPALRLKAVEHLAKNGIPVSVIIGPVLPGLTDHEIPAILKAAAAAGATGAHYTMLRLPYGVKDLFQTWLEDHYPDKAAKVLSHVRDVRGGRLNDPRFGTRMHGNGHYADNVADIFRLYKKKYNLNRRFGGLSTAHFRRDARSAQGDLFS
jgi:DNA repair photolyase